MKETEVRKCIRITYKQNRILSDILLSEITKRGKVIYESTLFREMIDNFICDYYSGEPKKRRKPNGTLWGYLHRAISNNETIDNSRVAIMFNTTNRVVSVTKSRVKKAKMETKKMLDEMA